MPSETHKQDLASQIRKSQLTDATGSGHSFLPLDQLERLITKESVKAELRRLCYFFPDTSSAKYAVRYAKRVFAILVNIGEPDAAKSLFSEGITDEHLPLHYHEGNDQKLLQSWKENKSFSTFSMWHPSKVHIFYDHQWKMLAPVLDDSRSHNKLHSQCPLPFTVMDSNKHDEAAIVTKCELPRAHYRGHRPYEEVRHLAVKVLDMKAAFEQERDNLNKLKEHNHLIRHLGTYERGQTYFIVFPWADGGSLDTFWKDQDSRTRDNALAIWSLRQMLGIAEALRLMHEKNIRHGDIKPDNILLYRFLDVERLVVADVGISRQHLQATVHRNKGTTTRATTPCYEAPETSGNPNEPRMRRYDMWSLGCVFLEFVVWLLHDMQTIESFYAARKEDMDSRFFAIQELGVRRIHRQVSNVIRQLRQDSRCQEGTAFDALIDLIENGLLRVEANERCEAEELVRRLSKIVCLAEKARSTLLDGLTSPGPLTFP
jgi:serine/threonine protein kinase